MVDEEDKYRNIPIPTYDEAVRPSSSQHHRGPQEISDDAERQGLLGEANPTPSTIYRAPTAESVRSSTDSDLAFPEVANNGDEARRQLEELDYLDPSQLDTSRRSPRPYHRSRLRSKYSLSQRWSNFSATLSSIRLPSFRSLYSPVANESSVEEQASTPSRLTWLSRVSRSWSIPERYRMSAPTFARLCGLFTIIALMYVLFALDMFPNSRQFAGARFDPESVRTFVQDNVDGKNIEQSLRHFTSYDHVAGTKGDLYMAEWMQERWKVDGQFDRIALLPYHVYLNYPGERSVSIVAPEDQKWTAALEEDQVYDDRQQTLAFHGHSKSGEVEGHLIYAHEGSRDDFSYLKDNGIVTSGSIALIKYFGSQDDPGLKIKAAEEAGCAGVLMYSDPSDVDQSNPWQPSADMLQRGGVSFMSRIIGDPLTPGVASNEQAKRIHKEDNPGLPQIPSLPLSWRDAQPLIAALRGHGIKLMDRWVHGSSDFTKEWYSGNISSLSDLAVPVVHLKNLNEEEERQKIWNLHGLIEGIETPEKKVVVGNHRDSWCFGSVDPGSASAVMMEVVRLFGELRKLGWRPLRTIEFASWDAAEYNLVGSTEYVEDNQDYLRQHGVAYINIDVGVYGSNFRAAGSPVWQKALGHVLSRVRDPHTASSTLQQMWTQTSTKLDGPIAAGDYVAFQDIVGMSSIDFGFKGRNYEYPFHSCHETFEWMADVGDPGFEYHKALAQIWALLILEVADQSIIPFDIRVYADSIKEYIQTLEDDAAALYAAQNHVSTASIDDVTAATNFSTQPLKEAALLLTENAATLHRFEDIWTTNVLGAGGFETRTFAFQRLDYNERLIRFEADLLDDRGISGREQFKHVVFGPQLWNTYDSPYFPGVRDALELNDEADWVKAREMVDRAAARIREAAVKLVK